MQEECTLNPPQEIKDLGQMSAALMSSIPFRSTHELAEDMFKKQMEPFPGEAEAPAPATTTSRGEIDFGPPTQDTNTDSTVPPVKKEEAGVNVGLVVGPLAAVAVLVLVGVLAAVFVRRHRTKQRKRKAMAAGSSHQVCEHISISSFISLSTLFVCTAAVTRLCHFVRPRDSSQPSLEQAEKPQCNTIHRDL